MDPKETLGACPMPSTTFQPRKLPSFLGKAGKLTCSTVQCASHTSNHPLTASSARTALRKGKAPNPYKETNPDPRTEPSRSQGQVTDGCACLVALIAFFFPSKRTARRSADADKDPLSEQNGTAIILVILGQRKYYCIRQSHGNVVAFSGYFFSNETPPMADGS